LPEPVAVDEPIVAIETPDVDDTPAEVRPTVTLEPVVEPAETAVVELGDTDRVDVVQPAFPPAIDWNPAPVEIDIPPQRTVKLVTDNPRVIIYWVLEEGNEGGGA
jgi:hypothetical protein